MRLLTFLPFEEIDEMAKWEGSELNKAKEILAYQLTELVHGEEEAKKHRRVPAHCSQVQILLICLQQSFQQEDFDKEGKIDLITLLVKAELVPSRSEGRRAIQQGGVSIDGEKLTDIYHTVEKDAFAGDGIVLKRGKKKFKKICVK